MTTQADIKLVIDQLDQIAYGDNDASSIESAIAMLETLGNQVATQAVVIEKLRDALVHVQPTLLNDMYKEEASYGKNFSGNRADKARENVAKVRKALSIPTDSKQILAEWLDAQLGEPVAWESPSMGLTYENHYSDNVPLFKKPEMK